LPATDKEGRRWGAAEKLLIESTTHFVVATDSKGAILGVITLHDLLRTEGAKAGS
jgi:CBS domain-containing protein